MAKASWNKFCNESQRPYTACHLDFSYVVLVSLGFVGQALKLHVLYELISIAAKAYKTDEDANVDEEHSQADPIEKARDGQ